MKKIILIALVAMVSVGASAQKGQWGIGLNVGYTPSLESGISVNNFGLAGKIQYGFANFLRGEITAGYDFKDAEVGLFNTAANFHFLIKLAKGVRIYPLVGVGYAHMDYGAWEDVNNSLKDALGSYYSYYFEDDDADDDFSKDKLLINAGLGAEFAVSSRLSISTEVKYQYIKDFSRLPINLGVVYKF